jgi:thiol-disulfide isomerase/thioredoxin
VVILDFWDRGCGWCIRAMPQLKAVQEEFKGQPVQILGMSLDSDEKDARLVVEQMGITYPVVRAIGLSEGYVAGIPHLVILDREGKIADVHIGYAPTLKERLSQSIRQILNRK